MTLLGIGEFARATGLSVPTLRAWADAGVLVPVEVDGASGYRRYATAQIPDARLARSLRRLEVPLADVAALLPQGRQAVADAVRRQARELTARAAAQRLLADHLLRRLSEEDPPVSTAVQLQTVPATPVLSARRTTGIAELSSWLDDAFAALTARAGGTAAGPPRTVFHAPVDDDRDGEVEACVPVAAEGDRVLAGGPAAVLVVEGEHARYPRLLDAYDDVAAWALDQGHELGDPPYEVYLDDDRVEVRWPLRG